MQSFGHVRLRTVRILGDQSIERNTEAGGLGVCSVGHWVLSKEMTQDYLEGSHPLRTNS